MVGSEKARSTNMNCEVMTVVKHDKSEPVVDITYGKYYQITLVVVSRIIMKESLLSLIYNYMHIEAD